MLAAASAYGKQEIFILGKNFFPPSPCEKVNIYRNIQVQLDDYVFPTIRQRIHQYEQT
jgi:hypothetical protein